MSEPAQVPPAEFRSYYGRPILKVTRWKEPHVPAYLFLGELSGATAVLAAVAAATGRRPLARAGRLICAAAAAAGGGFLIADLGRPERFLNMLRVAKPTSPMSMGTWLLVAHTGLSAAAAASEVTGWLPGLGGGAGGAAAVTGPLVATYPGALLADTAVPAWHGAHRELPLLFAGGAMTATGAAGLLAAAAWPGHRGDFGPARRLALVGAVAESVAGFGLERLTGPAGEPYRTGDGGRLLRAARAMTLAGGAAALVAGGRVTGAGPARRHGPAAVASAVLLAGGGLAAKFAVLRAGVASARDPRYVVAGQRAAGGPG